jgi:hypothetical protein
VKLRGLVPNSVSDLYNPRIGLPIRLQQNRQTDPWEYVNTQRNMDECGNWETEHNKSELEIKSQTNNNNVSTLPQTLD